MYEVSSDINRLETRSKSQEPCCRSPKNRMSCLEKPWICMDSRKNECPYFKQLTERTKHYEVDFGFCFYEYRGEKTA